MPVPVLITEELHGSPVVHLQWRQSTATRRFKINWADRFDFFLECFPGALAGYPYSARMPGYPFLYVESIDVEPMFGEEQVPVDLVPTFPPNYQYALMTVHYRSPNWDHQFQSHAPHATDGPGGNRGSTKGDGSPNDPNAVFITHEVDIGGEAYKLPNESVYWEYQINSATLATGPNDKNAQLKQGQTVGKVYAKAEHTITWNFCPFPPWDAIFKAIGTVNLYRIFGAPAGTALFLGARASREYSPGGQGQPVWKLTYKISTKNYNSSTSALDVNPIGSTSARGWNYFIRPAATGGANGFEKFQRLLTADGLPVYDATDFTLLFKTSGGPPY